MAVTLQKKYTVDLSSVVSEAVSSVRKVKSQQTNQKLSAYYEAVSTGMTYQAQVDFLQKQIDDENNATLKDTDLITSLTNKLSDTKKLARFDKYQKNYLQILDDLKAGKSNGRAQLEALKMELPNITDSALRQEVQVEIGNLEDASTNYDQTMIGNQAKKAAYDGTSKVLTAAIGTLQDERATAAIRGDDATVSFIDTQIAALTKNLQEKKVGDLLSDFAVKAATAGTTAQQKLNFLKQQIAGADTNTPITQNGVTYQSVQQYLQTVMSNYLAGTGGNGEFGDFFSDLDAQIKNTNSAAKARDGYPTTAVIASAKSIFDGLTSAPEMQPYLDKLGQVQSITISNMVNDNAQVTVDRASQLNATPGDLLTADLNLKALQSQFGIDTTAYQIQNVTNAADYVRAFNPPDATPDILAASANSLGLSGLTGAVFTVPGGEKKPTVPGATPGATTPAAAGEFTKSAGYTGGSIVDFLNLSGKASDFASRAAIAAQYGINNYTGSAEQNTQLLNTLKTEAQKAATSTTTPPGTTPGVTPTTPTTPGGSTPPSGVGSTYTGTSVVDFLNQSGKASDYTSRAALAQQYGIQNYTGTADQNTQLLNILKSGATPTGTTPSSAPGATPPPATTPASTPPSSAPTSGSIVDYLNSQGKASDYNSRAVLAQQYGISNYTGTAAQNTQLLGLVSSGAHPTPTPTPPVTSTPSTPPAQLPSNQPTQTTTQPSSAAPVTPPANVYSGASIVDYLGSTGKDSSYSSRAALAASHGITNYTGTAEQNTQLLKVLRGF